MRYLSIFTAMIFAAGIFMVGQAVEAGMHEGSEGAKSGYGSSSDMSQQKADQGMKSHQEQQAQQQHQQQQQMAAGQLSQEQVRELQKSLNDRGFQSGPVDGIIGPKTKRALRNFQQFEGLTASGEPNQKTLEALDIQAGEQEFFGISPEFGQEDQQKKQQEQQQMEQEQKQQDMQQEQQKQQPMNQ